MSEQNEIIWFDPGTTTGLVILSFDPAWIKGEGAPSWEAMGDVCELHMEQYGRHSRDPQGKPMKADPLMLELERANFDYFANDVSVADAILYVLEQHPEAAWGFEDFIVNFKNRSRDFLSPVRIASMVVFGQAEADDMREPFVQSSSIKNVVGDDRLDAAGLYRKGFIHGNDAARHAAHFLRRCRSDPKLRARAFPKG